MNCKYCGNAYPYRKGKMYCSPSCKTMAHRDKVNGISHLNENPGEKYNTERTIFYLSDFDQWEGAKIFSFIVFCFIIKGMPENEDPDFLKMYATSISDDELFYKNIEESNHPICKEYKKFQELFFSNKYQIKKDRSIEAVINS